MMNVSEGLDSLTRPQGQQPTSILKNTIVTTMNQSNLVDTRTVTLDHHPYSSSYKLVDVLESRYFSITFWTLMVTAIFNLVLSLWIIKSLQLGGNGFGSGHVQFLKNGLDIRTPAKFDQMTAELIKATSNPDPLMIQSKKDQSVSISSADGRSFLSIGDDRMEIQTPRFIVMDTDGQETLFEITSNEMAISSFGEGSSTDGRSHSVGGYSVVESISTDSVTGTPSHDLRIESRTESINVKGQSINVESRAGSVATFSLHDTKLDTNILKIDSKRVSFKGLTLSDKDDHKDDDDGHHGNSNHVCSDDDGKLFLSSSSCSSSLDNNQQI